ncbi:signal peptidase I [Blastopirellula sp. JC732]|uniref:Signal peptidase I n=1 Tax=Blastopirellula sediminis TaxID=2894196 RepID=A0A9X1SG21_9BACT|nr:signal peptidase I [Blastopirellula sediminis]MCC9606980.1 signal peptidase I [Blastopirellula sediminis]MCC9629725.1 signal peptidase I [Blastopirellula sediminis]
MKRLLALGVLFAIAAVAGWYVGYAQRPTYRIAGPSMAPALLGPHYDVACPECGHTFAIDATRGPIPTAVCDYCGARAPVKTGDVKPGDAIKPLAGEIERFDLVMFPDPENPAQQVVKRVVGLPGETVECRDGDLWINGERYVKSWEELSRVMIPIYEAGDPLADDPRIKISSDGWTEYHHQVHSQGIQIAGAAPPLDDYPYNQGLPGKLHPLDELICTFTWQAAGLLEVRFGFDGYDQQICSNPSLETTYRWILAGEEPPPTTLESSGSGHSPPPELAVHAALCDGKLQFGGEGRTSGVELPTELDFANCSAVPVRILAGSGQVKGLKIYRDLRYADFPETEIPADAYFVLGDNVLASRDSRDFGPISAKDARRMVPASRPD